MAEAAQNKGLNRFQKLATYRILEADFNGRVNLTNEVEQKVNVLRQTAKAEKRYNPLLLFNRASHIRNVPQGTKPMLLRTIYLP